MLGGKQVVQIAGAGTLGMAMLIVSLSMLFIASMVAYLFIRSQSTVWPPIGMPPVPTSLWLSTIIILAASVTAQMAHNAVRRDQDARLTRNLIATFVIGMLFLIMQTINWFEFYLRIRNIQLTGAYLGMFFVLTGLHAAHVIGGLIPLAFVIHRARQRRYSANFHPGVRYITIYWHFLDIIWVALFSVLYF
jgi:cytochrome c oxidase subunit 3